MAVVEEKDCKLRVLPSPVGPTLRDRIVARGTKGRAFVTTGAIRDTKSTFYFHRSRLDHLVQKLCSEKEVAVLHAHRQCGKTSFCWQVDAPPPSISSIARVGL